MPKSPIKKTMQDLAEFEAELSDLFWQKEKFADNPHELERIIFEINFISLQIIMLRNLIFS